jgi:putative sigma-54 modulation protein
MRLELTGRHVDITPALRRLVEKKLGKLERLLNDHAVSAHAVLSVEKHRRRADITIHARGERFLHGVGAGAAWEASVGQAIERLTQQAQRLKGKRQVRKGAPRLEAAEAAVAEEAAPQPAETARTPRARTSRMPPILKASRQPLRPMSVADATRALDSDGDTVVVFRDVETATVSVLYRRRNGDLTLVQTEA